MFDTHCGLTPDVISLFIKDSKHMPQLIISAAKMYKEDKEREVRGKKNIHFLIAHSPDSLSTMAPGQQVVACLL